MRDPELNKDFYERLEKLGYKAIVLTVDHATMGNREQDPAHSSKLIQDLQFGTVNKYLGESSKYGCTNWIEFMEKYKHDGYGWKDIKEIKKLTRLPIVLKGIQCAEDAKMAVESGANAIWVSNHGGRQLDTVPATIEVLEEWVKAVEGKIEVYFDGGVRRGTDVLKALALGAQAVFIGRPQLWGLACNGQKGVEDVINILNKELKKAMILTDCKNIKEITKEKVIHTAYSNPRYFVSKM